MTQSSSLSQPLLSTTTTNNEEVENTYCDDDDAEMQQQRQQQQQESSHDGHGNVDDNDNDDVANSSNNIKRIFALTWFAFTSRSIWIHQSSSLSMYIWLVFNNNNQTTQYIGYITCAMGICQVIVVVVVSLSSSLSSSRRRYSCCWDWMKKRNNILKLSSLVGIGAVTFTGISIFRYQQNFIYLLSSLCLWGIMWGISDTSLPSLFADSIIQHQYSSTSSLTSPSNQQQQQQQQEQNQFYDYDYYYQRGSRIIKSANSIGPFIALIVFRYIGSNDWTVTNCSIVIGVGLVFSLPIPLLLCTLHEIIITTNHYENNNVVGDDNDDLNDIGPPEEIMLSSSAKYNKKDHSYCYSAYHQEQQDIVETNHESEEDPLLLSPPPQLSTTVCTSINNDSGIDREDNNNNNCVVDSITINERQRQQNDETTAHTTCCCCCCCKEKMIIPILITMSDICSSFASGMSIRYFPVFLASNIGLSPVHVQGLYVLTPLGQAATSALAKSMASRFGPGFVSIIFHWAFVTFLLSMLYCYENAITSSSSSSSFSVVPLLYLIHASFMNSTCSLSRSITSSVLTEEEEEEDDGCCKWITTHSETIQLLLWSGGAATGGILVGMHGILFCFYATAALQFIASLPLLVVCCVMTTASRRKSNNENNNNENLMMPGTPQTTPEGESEAAESSASTSTVFEESREYAFVPPESSASSTSVHPENKNNNDDGDDEFYDCRERSFDFFDYYEEASYSTCTDNNNVSSQQTETETDRDRIMEVAVYTNHQCLYSDGSPAYVPSGECIDTIPECFMSITNGSRDRALVMWEKTQKWRRENDVWKVHTMPNPWYLKFKDAYPHSIHGWTKQGDIVIYERTGKMRLKNLLKDGCTVDDMVSWYIFFLEYMRNVIMHAIAEQRRTTEEDRFGPKFSFLVVMDMEGAGVSYLTSEVLMYLKKSGNINASHYPNSMKLAVLIKTGAMLAKLSSVVQAVLPRSVKFEVHDGNNYQNALREYIDNDQIPMEYGGSSPYPLGQHPFESSLIDRIIRLDAEAEA